jgi:hypothetical protein
VTVLVEQNIGRFQVSVDDESRVHVLEAENDLGCVEFDLLLGEDTVLR